MISLLRVTDSHSPQIVLQRSFEMNFFRLYIFIYSRNKYTGSNFFLKFKTLVILLIMRSILSKFDLEVDPYINTPCSIKTFTYAW